MERKIETIDSKEEWEDFFKGVKPHTFLQSWNWGEFNKKIGSKIFRIGIKDQSGGMVGIALVLKIEAKRGSFLFIPHGPIVMDKSRSPEALADKRQEGQIQIARSIGRQEAGILQELFGYLKNLAQQEKCAFLRVSALMEKNEDNNAFFHALGFREAPVHMMHPELAWILDISKSEDELLKDMRKTTRYSIKKSKNEGVKVFSSKNSDDIDKFWDLYQATVSRQHFTPFSKEYIRKEVETLARDEEILIFFAQYGEEIISAAVVVYNAWSGFYHHGASVQKYTQLNASHLIQWEALCEAKRRGCAYYNFWGVVPENAQTHPWAGISLFKRGFGGWSQEYVHAKDLVFSPKYWLTYTVEKVRRLRRRL